MRTFSGIFDAIDEALHDPTGFESTEQPCELCHLAWLMRWWDRI